MTEQTANNTEGDTGSEGGSTVHDSGATGKTMFGDGKGEAAGQEGKTDANADDAANGDDGKQAGAGADTGKADAGKEQPDSGEGSKEGDKPASADSDSPGSDGQESKDDSGAERGSTEIDAAELNLPDGFEMNDEALTSLLETAKDKKWSQEEVQAQVDAGAKLIQDAFAKEDAQAEALRKEWRDEIAKDPDIGGDKLEAAKAAGKAAIMHYGGEEALKVFDQTALADNPHVARMLAKIGADLAEDTTISGGKSEGDGKSAAQILFDKTPSN